MTTGSPWPGSTDLSFTEDRAKRFDAYGWHVVSVDDGNDLDAIDQALRSAQDETERPSIIFVHTHIGFGSPNKKDSFEAHGSRWERRSQAHQAKPELAP